MASRFVYQPRVSQAPTPSEAEGVKQATPVGEVGEGLDQLGQVVQGIAVDAWRREAASEASRGLAELQSRFTKRLVQATSQKGEKAFGADRLVGEALGNDIAEVRGTLRNELARRRFDEESQRLLGGANRTLTVHVAEQARAAQADSLKARLQAARDVVSLDPSQADDQIASLEPEVRAMALSSDGAEQDVAELRADLRADSIVAYLNAGNVDGATSVLLRHEAELGARGPDLRRKILAFGLKQTAETRAMDFTRKATDARGFVDRAAAEAMLDQIEDVGLKDETRKRLDVRLDTLEKSEKARGGAIYGDALAQFGQTRTLDPVALAELDAGPQSWQEYAGKLRTMQDRMRARWRKSAADQRREIREDNERAMNDYLRIPLEERVNENLQELVGHRVGNDIGFGAIEVQQTKDRAALAKRLSLSEAEFVRRGKDLASWRTLSKEEQDDLDLVLRRRYSDLAREAKGEPPPEQVDASLEGAVAPVVKKRKLLWDTTEPAWKRQAREIRERRETSPAAVAPAPARRPTKYLVSPDGRQRVPVFADGSRGPVEPVP